MRDLNFEFIARKRMHPTAMAMLETLAVVADQPNPCRTPKQLSAVLGERLGNISYHMRHLKRMGLVVLDHTEPRRGAVAHFYRLAEGVTQ